MGTAFDTLQQASFDGITFPVQEISVLGTTRDHVHEFPHTDGGQIEKLGTRIIETTLVCPFYATFPKYPRLWPGKLDAIWNDWKQKLTAPLHVPTIGTFDAYIHQIRRVANMQRNLAGETVEIVFWEDNPTAFVANALIAAGDNGLAAQKATFDDAVANAGLLAQLAGVLAGFDDAVNDVLAIQDQADIYGLLLASRITRLANQCDAIDRALSLNQIGSAAVIDALQDLWATAIGISNDLMAKKSDLRLYTVPTLMAITDVSTRLYGDNSHTVELLQLNDIPDAFAISPNTKVRYYPTAA